jgi:hypothetical protein
LCNITNDGRPNSFKLLKTVVKELLVTRLVTYQTDEHGQPVQAVKDEWVVGVASLELPWIGAIKLWASGTGDQVPSRSWSRLLVVIASIITAPVVLEMITDRISGSRSDSDDELGSTEEE